MNQEEAIETIRSEAFISQFVEHIEALAAASGAPEERTDLLKQYKFLEFVTDQYPDAAVEYLSREPAHFAGLVKQNTNDAMAIYVRKVADKILGYSVVGKVIIEIGKRWKSTESTHLRTLANGAMYDMNRKRIVDPRNVFEDLVKQAEEAEQNAGTD